MKSLIRTLSLWLVLAGACWLLLLPETPYFIGVIWGVVRVFSLPLAIVLTWAAVAALPDGRAGRWGRWPFWTITLAGWLAVVLLTEGRLEAKTHHDDRQMLMISTIGAALAVVWIVVRAKAWPGWRTLREVTVGALVLAVLGAAGYGIYEAQTRRIQAQAAARWSAIGHPVDDIEKTVPAVAENAGSTAVRQVFRDLLGRRFYKEGTPASRQEPAPPNSEAAWKFVTSACDIISAKLPPADELDLSKLPVAALEPHAAELEAAYRRILATEPPQWAFQPEDGMSISVPNFLATRMFAQLASAECLRRLAAGDAEGARRAVDACRRMAENLERNPAYVALMMHVAVEASVALPATRLSSAADSLETIARDARQWRAAMVRSMQWESWILLRHVDQVATSEVSDEPSWERGRLLYLPPWARRLAVSPLVRREAARSALKNAEHAALRLSPDTLLLPDGGVAQEEAIELKDAAYYEVSWSRGAMRLNSTLLLREQAALIRDARACLAAGRPVESRASVVLPALRWELTADPVKRTLATRLAHAPQWLLDGAVTGGAWDSFWALPLDGSIAWQFRAPVTGTAAR